MIPSIVLISISRAFGYSAKIPQAYRSIRRLTLPIRVVCGEEREQAGFLPQFSTCAAATRDRVT
jgi:hypothetical protein